MSKVAHSQGGGVWFVESLEARTLLATAPSYLEFELSVGDFAISRRDDGLQEIHAEGLTVSGRPAWPALPGKMLRIAVPADADLSSVRFTPTIASSRVVEGRYEIAAMGEPVADGITPKWSDRLSRGRDMLVYTTDRLVDKSVAKLVDVQEMGAWKLAEIWYSPFAYNPDRGELQVTDHVSFRLEYQLGAPTAAPASVTTQQAREVVDNYDQASGWYASLQPTTTAIADYLIVTTTDIQAHSSQLANFVAHKQSRGMTVRVVTQVDWGAGTGDTAANNIRTWLVNHYSILGAKYLLLIGDPNPKSGDVPMKKVWPIAPQELVPLAYEPTDYFYADLTSNWNADGDNKWGEWNQPGINQGDLTAAPIPELMVGRIPFKGSYTDLDQMLAKTIAYESQTDIAWRQNILLPMPISAYENPNGHRQDGTELGDPIRDNIALSNGYGAWRMYEKAGLAPVTTTAEEPLSQAALISRWANNPFGVVAWAGHGAANRALRYVWLADDDGNGWPDGGDTVDYDMIMSADFASLNNSRPSVVLDFASKSGSTFWEGWEDTSSFLDQNSMVYASLRNGAINAYWATDLESGEGEPFDLSRRSSADPRIIEYDTIQQLVENPHTMSTGAALNWNRINLIVPPPPEHYVVVFGWMNLTSINLYGDPSITLGASALHKSTDLVGSQFSIADKFVGSGTASASFSVLNQGGVPAGAFNVRFYLSEDANINPATDVLLTIHPSDPLYVASRPSDYRLGSIGAYSAVSATVKLVVPPNDPFPPGGDRYIGMFVDAGNEVIESFAGSESNNRNRGDGLDRTGGITYRREFYREPLDVNPAWTLQGQWQFGVPQGHGGNISGNPDPTSGHTGSNVYGVNLAGDYTIPTPLSYLTTKPINCQGYKSIQLSFWRYLNTDYPNYATADVQYSTNGTTWTTLWQKPSNNQILDDADWQYQFYPLGSDADEAATIYLRWGYSVSAGAWEASGWNIDDVVLVGEAAGLSVQPPSLPVLAPLSDTGVSSTDKLTRLDNSSLANRLTFNVGGTLAGALVKLYAGGTVIGSASASGATTSVLTNGTFDLTDGNHQITATQTVSGTESALSPALTISVDTLAPAQQSFSVGSSAQRSMVNELQVVFSERVNLSNALLLRTRTGMLVPGVALQISNPLADGRTYQLTFTGAAVVGGSLPDGLYRLVSQAAGISDDAGNSPASDASNYFHRLFGDADGDRDVDRTDLAAFKGSLNRPAKYVWYFDYLDDNLVNNADLLQFKQRMNRAIW